MSRCIFNPEQDFKALKQTVAEIRFYPGELNQSESLYMCFGCDEHKKANASGGDAKGVAVGDPKNPPQEYAEKCLKQ